MRTAEGPTLLSALIRQNLEAQPRKTKNCRSRRSRLLSPPIQSFQWVGTPFVAACRAAISNPQIIEMTAHHADLRAVLSTTQSLQALRRQILSLCDFAPLLEP